MTVPHVGSIFNTRLFRSQSDTFPAIPTINQDGIGDFTSIQASLTTSFTSGTLNRTFTLANANKGTFDPTNNFTLFAPGSTAKINSDYTKNDTTCFSGPGIQSSLMVIPATQCFTFTTGGGGAAGASLFLALAYNSIPLQMNSLYGCDDPVLCTQSYATGTWVNYETSIKTSIDNRLGSFCGLAYGHKWLITAGLFFINGTLSSDSKQNYPSYLGQGGDGNVDGFVETTNFFIMNSAPIDNITGTQTVQLTSVVDSSLVFTLTLIVS